ncbi:MULTISPECIES: hypothetical protein [Sphingomonas]|uniref:Uncharacterized protein n=1 Tax=Sphingomonas adhaesiva TaxID=28212 RepID=A0A2A4IAI3_9SPHN|nr:MULTISPECIES: hypothetical protein [Sphingomonas]PCG15014.1 hypothetical protein COA07_05505 [Sphingomonas adhaesiva]PZU81286.1 MAG: hypothetical protein DI530_02065 [Sphingomonas sp.]
MTGAVIHALAYSGVALLLLTMTGNWACRLMVNLIGLRDAMAGVAQSTAAAGRYIGALERLVIAIGLVVHSWEAVAAVIALKTIARFKELDKQLPAEYFLVGSLFSLLWAIAVTTAWLAYDRHVGANIAGAIVPLVGKPGG